jgi:organic hydroperoxide reductase OsmC/OhrA
MAHEYRVTVFWTRGDAAFVDNRYSRGHVWKFDGGIEVPASSAPSSVRLPYSVAEAVDPEEALVAAISSCHMLTFLFVAAKAGFVVDRYEDDALGIMTKNARGKLFVSKVTLRPAIAFSGEKQPSPAEMEALHHQAHEECYIANSVVTEIVVEPSTAGAT